MQVSEAQSISDGGYRYATTVGTGGRFVLALQVHIP
jgi:hypothetical protein